MVYENASPRVVGAAVSGYSHERQYLVVRAGFPGVCTHAFTLHKPVRRGYAGGQGIACREWFRSPACMFDGSRHITGTKSGFDSAECS